MATPLSLLREQRSHVLVVLSAPQPGRQPDFLTWYRDSCRRAVLDIECLVGAEHYEQHEVDITKGNFQRSPLPYLGLYELSLDGAPQAESVIERIADLYRAQAAAEMPAMWLYYPASEKVGRSARVKPSMITVAFANGVEGQEAEFREFYATRHIRHALNISAFVSGQCFDRTQFQRPGALEAIYSMIAIYEQEGTPEDILNGFASLPKGTLAFPALDRVHFAESVFRPIE